MSAIAVACWDAEIFGCSTAVVVARGRVIVGTRSRWGPLSAASVVLFVEARKPLPADAGGKVPKIGLRGLSVWRCCQGGQDNQNKYFDSSHTDKALHQHNTGRRLIGERMSCVKRSDGALTATASG
jgi:hypothetical protein